MPLNIIEGLTEEGLAKPVKEFVTWPETAILIDQTIEEAYHSLQSRKIKNKAAYFYVLDHQNALLGVVPARLLILNDCSTKISEILQPDIISIREDTLMREALPIFAYHRLLAIPVINQENILIGTIDLVYSQYPQLPAPRKIDKKSADDIFQLIGLSLEQVRMRTLWSEYRFRMPWLFCNLIAGLLCALIAKKSRLVLDQTIIISMFIPLVLTLCESISMQSMTLSLRFLHRVKVPWERFNLRMIKDFQTAFVMGLTCSIIVCLSYFFYREAQWMAFFAIAQSICLAMVASAFFGTLLPMVLHAWKLDPKVAAGPVVLMCVDIVAISIYFGIATFWLL